MVYGVETARFISRAVLYIEPRQIKNSETSTTERLVTTDTARTGRPLHTKGGALSGADIPVITGIGCGVRITGTGNGSIPRIDNADRITKAQFDGPTVGRRTAIVGHRKACGKATAPVVNITHRATDTSGPAGRTGRRRARRTAA